MKPWINHCTLFHHTASETKSPYTKKLILPRKSTAVLTQPRKLLFPNINDSSRKRKPKTPSTRGVKGESSENVWPGPIEDCSKVDSRLNGKRVDSVWLSQGWVVNTGRSVGWDGNLMGIRFHAKVTDTIGHFTEYLFIKHSQPRRALPLKGWMTRQIFFGLSESVCLKTYLSRIKVHTEQGM